MTYFIVRLRIIKYLHLFIQSWVRVGVPVKACIQKSEDSLQKAVLYTMHILGIKLRV